MVTWEDVHVVLQEELGHSVGQAVCQNIAASLNEKAKEITLDDIVPPPKECHANALTHYVKCTVADPCKRCKGLRKMW